MAASNTDKLRKTFVGGTTLSSSVNASTTTIPLASTNGWPTDTAIDVVIDRVNSDGEATPDKKECITGVVDGTGLLSAIRGIGGVAQSHTSGAIVEASIATAKSHNDMIDALIRTHEQNGDLKENTVGTGQLKENSVTTEKVLDGSITPNKLSSSLLMPTMVLNKEYEIGKIEVDTNDTRTLYFKKFESTIPSGADPFAIDVPSGTDAVKLVNYVVKYNDTNLIPMRTGASNYLAFCPDVSSNVRIGIKRDSSGAWAGNALTVYAWYYKSS